VSARSVDPIIGCAFVSRYPPGLVASPLRSGLLCSCFLGRLGARDAVVLGHGRVVGAVADGARRPVAKLGHHVGPPLKDDDIPRLNRRGTLRRADVGPAATADAAHDDALAVEAEVAEAAALRPIAVVDGDFGDGVVAGDLQSPATERVLRHATTTRCINGAGDSGCRNLNRRGVSPPLTRSASLICQECTRPPCRSCVRWRSSDSRVRKPAGVLIVSPPSEIDPLPRPPERNSSELPRTRARGCGSERCLLP
jgi:hypothetical protein